MSKALPRHVWQDHISAWQASQLSKKVYCQQHQLGFSTFQRKQHELQRESHSEGLTLVPVQRPSSATTPTEQAPITFSIYSPTGWRLEGSTALPLSHITALLQRLPS